MPLYDLRCGKCGAVEMNVYQPAALAQPRCERGCGGMMERVWYASAPVHTFQAGFFENAADENGQVPYFDSRRKYKNYLKEHDMYADYVEGY